MYIVPDVTNVCKMPVVRLNYFLSYWYFRIFCDVGAT